MSRVKPISQRTQLWLIAAGYAFTFAICGAWAITRYLWELYHRDDVSAASGMYAFGDVMLAVMIFCLMMVPTFFLLRLMAHNEKVSAVYSKALLVFSVTVPICLALIALTRHFNSNFLVDFYFLRVLLSPFVLVVTVLSRILARFRLAKRLTSYASLCEGFTFVLAVALFIGT